MKLDNIKLLEVLDSNGKLTLKVILNSGTYRACAIVPGGTSKGIHEAKTVSTIEALKSVPELIKTLKGKELSEIDNLITDLPGNISTGLSMASKRLEAKTKGVELYELFGGKTLPVPFMNIINGGAHAGNKLAFQEFMIIPLAKTFKESLTMATDTYQALKENLKKKYGHSAINVGMEGGFAPDMKNVEDALKIIKETLVSLGYDNKVKMGIDAAMSANYKDGLYSINGSTMNHAELVKYYEKLVNDYGLISIEDPFHEEDFKGYAELTKLLKGRTQVVGDDLTVTNPERVTTAVSNKSCNCLLLKVNQVGSVSKSLEAVNVARKDNWNIMVSHRSGDSCDAFIADLAVGINSGQIKTGAPARGERVAKYNRLLEIEDSLGSKAVYPKKIL